VPSHGPRLLEDGGMRRSAIEAPVALRARLKYGFLVLQALLERRPDIALKAYELGKRLPREQPGAPAKESAR
jgi:hypothetical protein